MSNIQSLIDSTYNIVRTALSEVDSLNSGNTITRSKIENSIRKNLESLSQRTSEIEKQIQTLPIHEKSRILLIVRELRDNHKRISQNLRPIKQNSIELPLRSSEDYSSVSNAEILRKTETMKKKQDQDIDKLLETISNVKSTGKGIGDELDYHIKLLDATEDNIDSTTIYLTKTSEKLVGLIDKASNCCLITIIIALLILIFFTIVYL